MRYRIVCTTQEPAWKDHEHAAIDEVGTGTDSDKWSERWTVDEVVNAIEDGDTFYTKGTRTGKQAEVKRFRCTTCDADRIRSAPDASTDNNLDSLPRCSW